MFVKYTKIKNSDLNSKLLKKYFLIGNNLTELNKIFFNNLNLIKSAEFKKIILLYKESDFKNKDKRQRQLKRRYS
jgi:hypothetical protein